MAKISKRRKTFQRLFDIAEDQEGFFTAQQAEKVGVDKRNHSYHVRMGNWIREDRGVFRLANFPFSEGAQLMQYYLWSRDRSGKPQGVYSHDTALSLFDLSDLNPAKLHMTVPATFRRRNPIPGVLRLHRGIVPPEDITKKFGVPVTHPLRSLVDLIESNYTEDTFIRQGLLQGLRQGIILERDLDSPRINKETRKILKDLARRTA